MKFRVSIRPTLPRLLSRPEVWGFGFTNFLLWVLVGPMVQELVGTAAPALWLAASVAGIVTLLQIRPLVAEWPQLTGGIASYLARLHAGSIWVARYAAMAYLHFWLLIIPTAAILVSQLVGRQLGEYGMGMSIPIIRIVFIGLLAVIAFGGTRALSLLHLMLFVPGLAVMAVFVITGILHPAPDQAPAITLAPIGLSGWGLAAFLTTYAVYGLDTSTAFTAEAFRPQTIRRCLGVAAVLVVPLMGGGAYVLAKFGSAAPSGAGIFDRYVAIASIFWGTAAPGLVTFLLATAAILGGATAIAICPRMLHQQAVDGLFAPLWGRVSPRNVLRAPLVACMVIPMYALSLTMEQLVTLTTASGLTAYVLLHLGLWTRRGATYVRWPVAALGLALLGIAVSVGAASTMGWRPVLIGLAMPLLLVVVDRALALLPVRRPEDEAVLDEPTGWRHAAVPVEIAVVVLLVVGGLLAGWVLGRNATLGTGLNAPLGVLVALFAVLAGVAWSSWTSTRAMESLEQARGETQEVLDSAMDAVLTVDARGRICSANPAAGPLFGQEPRALRGDALPELIEGLIGDPASWRDWKEHTLRRSDGTLRSITVVARPLLRALRPRFTVTLHDLTGARAAARELLLSQERLSMALAVANEVVWDWHLESGEFVIAAADDIAFGHHVDEGKGLRDWWLSLVHPDDQPALVEALTAHQRGTTDQFEAGYRIRHKDGSYRWVFSRGRVVERSPAGDPLRMIGTTIDQTERRRLETQLVHAQKMDALGQLAGGVAHDFNNALQAILGVADVLRFSPADTIGERDADLRMIRMAAERAAGLTRQLLTFSRQQATRPEVIDLNAAINDVVRLIRRLVSPQIVIERRLAPDLGYIRADPALLEHALLNLAVNARDAMPGMGTLTLSTARTVAGPEERARVSVTITDTGVGMDAGLVERIFEPFFTTKAAGKGTGLGLPMVYGFVQQADGRIEVDSTPGAGTSVCMSFPEEPRPTTDASEDGEDGLPRGEETVLLVEDEEPIRELCGSTLRGLGYTVLEAASAEAAITSIEASPSRIDLVITDIAMPGIGGLALGKWIAEHRPELPVGYISGYIPDAAQERISVDRSVLLLKPFRLSALAELVRRLLDRDAVPQTMGGD